MDALELFDFVERRRNEGISLAKIKRELGKVRLEWKDGQ